MKERCELVALCQRDITQHFDGLARDRANILKRVARFVRRELAPALSQVARPASPSPMQGEQQSSSSAPPPPPSSFSRPRLSALATSRLVADVYVHAKGKVRLVDLALPEGTTSPLLFSSWEEVFSGSDNDDGDREEEEANGNGIGDENDGEEDEDASDAEFSLLSSSSSSSSSSDEGDDEDDDEDGNITTTANNNNNNNSSGSRRKKKKRVRFRVVSAAGGIAPGRTLYGAPHDFLDGECVEALVERLRTSEG